ncbi:hypothetical protein [Streptomyces sp. NPDC001927]
MGELYGGEGTDTPKGEAPESGRGSEFANGDDFGEPAEPVDDASPRRASGDSKRSGETDEPDGVDDSDGPEEPEGPEGPDEPDGAEEPDEPDGPEEPDGPDGAEGPDYAEGPDGPEGRDEPDEPEEADEPDGAEETDEPDDRDEPVWQDRGTPEEPDAPEESDGPETSVLDREGDPGEHAEPVAMFRKSVFDGQDVPEALTPEKRVAIEGLYAEAEESDIAIISGEEADSYFEWVASREEEDDPESYYAVTLGDTILVRDSHKFDTRTIGEEMIHSKQQTEGRGDVFECEIEAREGLLANPDKYALTEEEIGELKAEIATMKERGYY